MLDIQNYIQKLGDDSLSSEEQALALQEIEKSLVQSQLKHEEVVQSSTDLVVEAVKSIEDTVYTKFKELSTSESMKGPKGNNGRDGKDGKDGKDGVGYNGKDGKDGVDGIDGEDGRYVTDVEIAFDDTLLVTLSDNTTIKTTKEIKGPKGDMGPQGLRGSNGNGVVVGGSTGQVLTKVSNTDYDVTWSTNGAGTVTSVGGTGTVNGLSLSGTVTSSGNLTLGGTLDLSTPPAIGATTPAAGTFTTITGQTVYVAGGNNLITYSNTFTNAIWSATAATPSTTVATTDPTGGSNAYKLVATAVSGSHLIANLYATTSNTAYTYSFYAKSAEYTFVQIDMSDNSTGDVFFIANLSAGTIGTVGSNGSWTKAAGTITSVGNGWYRLSLTGTKGAGSSLLPKIQLVNNSSATSFTGDGTSGVYIYGGQLEQGAVAANYVPTTTAAITTTNLIGISGGQIFVDATGSMSVQPAGTGAIQAQATTSSTVGGNARGANAVDWQTLRSAASQVASSAQAVISGGAYNTANGGYSAIVGGTGNLSSGFGAFVGSGSGVQATGSFAAASGGVTNTSSGSYSTVAGGYTNTAAGFYNFIGNGQSNSGTANAAVTTQSGTMNGTTAVTLSGSNASIKIGQYITGTSIATNTYVAAISGTSLTLSQVASGSSTSTLSFFTPHGVVVGGGNNQATGSYSFIGGGGDAGTAANRNVASGDWSVVCGGTKNTASGIGAFVGGGGVYGDGSVYPNSAAGNGSFVGGGISNTASSGSAGTVVVGGYSNTVNGAYSSILGGYNGTARSIQGNFVMPACVGPISTAAQGYSQAALLVLGKQTTDATPTVLCSNGSAASGTNQVILPNNSAYFFTGEVVSGVTGGGDTKGWSIEGVIKRGAGVATAALVGTPTVTSLYGDAGAATWALAVAADTTNGGLKVTFTGQASTTIRTVCQIRTTEMTY